MPEDGEWKLAVEEGADCDGFNLDPSTDLNFTDNECTISYSYKKTFDEAADVQKNMASAEKSMQNLFNRAVWLKNDGLDVVY